MGLRFRPKQHASKATPLQIPSQLSHGIDNIPPGNVTLIKMSTLTSEQIAVYRNSSIKRQQVNIIQTTERREKAWRLVQRAAQLLRDKFGATKVVVFGSLLSPANFTNWSDIDIAAWGISPEDTFHAIGEVWELSPEIEINLVDINVAQPNILMSIESTGQIV